MRSYKCALTEEQGWIIRSIYVYEPFSGWLLRRGKRSVTHHNSTRNDKSNHDRILVRLQLGDVRK
jgi:hypothetical protein